MGTSLALELEETNNEPQVYCNRARQVHKRNIHKLKPNETNINIRVPINHRVELFIHGYARQKFNSDKIPKDILTLVMRFTPKGVLFITADDFFRIHMKKKDLQFHYIADTVNVSRRYTISKWNKRTNSGGVIQIYSKKAIIIEKHSAFNLDGAGYLRGYGRGKGGEKDFLYFGGGGHAVPGKHFKSAEGGKAYGDKTLNRLSFGSPSGSYYDFTRGGGIIELIAETVINKGTITCSARNGYGGSGGSIKIHAKTFENYGSISAKGGKGNENNTGDGGCGYIAIYCESYTNNGVINPWPYVEKNCNFKNPSFTPINQHYLY